MVSTVATSSAQQIAPLSKHALAVRKKVESLSPAAPISVVLRDAPEEFGRFVSSDQDGFVFYDVDKKTNTTLRYSDVRKIKDGYGGYNALQRRHTDRTKGIVIAVVAVGVLAGLIAAVAAAKN